MDSHAYRPSQLLDAIHDDLSGHTRFLNPGILISEPYPKSMDDWSVTTKITIIQPNGIKVKFLVSVTELMD